MRYASAAFPVLKAEDITDRVSINCPVAGAIGVPCSTGFVAEYTTLRINAMTLVKIKGLRLRFVLLFFFLTRTPV